MYEGRGGRGWRKGGKRDGGGRGRESERERNYMSICMYAQISTVRVSREVELCVCMCV